MTDERKKSHKEAREQPAETKATPKDGEKTFPVIGIGASAGGIEALQTLFTHLTPSLRAAFILVQHLQPDRPSMLVEILSRLTTMPVVQAEEGMQVEAGRVYVIPPDRFLALKKDMLFLTPPPADRVVRMPVDFLFRSLAEEKGEAAIGIILSGSGSDGTLGMRAIHGAGGVTIVQEPASANYAQMPESAISTGIVDYIVPPDKIGVLLAQFITRLPFVKGGLQPEKIEAVLDSVFAVMRATMGHDFSLYKPNTVLRRIARRMNVVNVRDPREYVRYLEDHRKEVELLFRDLLIKVTSFFRDAEGFKVLEKEILPRLLLNIAGGTTVRVWVPACSTGEEAYSLAIILAEFDEAARRNVNFQIFATDLDGPSVEQARVGLYPLDIATDVSEERLTRFFIREEGGYRVKKELRERIVFAVQDVLKDPPFTKLDLLSCRNLMIYLRPEAQKKLVELFHYSLRPGGMLLLGSSETIGNREDLFQTFGRRWKFFEARLAPRLPAFQTGIQAPVITRHLEPTITPPRRETGLKDAARREILDHFSPPSVVVDATGNIVFFHGQTGRYLEPASGEARFSVYDMAKEGVRFGVRAALHEAMNQKTESVSQNVTLKTEAGPRGVRVKAKPVSGMEGFYMVVFEEVILPQPRTKIKGAVNHEEDNRVRQLEEELRRTRAELQSSIEEYQSAIEEQKSTSEELQSSNEELQSTNEELETSKEELQSINEELVTVNGELEIKIQQLSLAESDMKNLLDSVSVGVIFVDMNLRIKSFTAQVTSIANLLASDAGRPLGDISTRIKGENLSLDIRTVLDTLQVLEKEVETETGDWYLMRVRPYRTSENVIGGAVITFNDVTSLKKASEERAATEVIRATVNTVKQPLLTLSSDLRIITANPAFYRLFNLTEQSVEGKSVYEVADGMFNIAKLCRLLEQVLPSSTVVEDYPVNLKVKDKKPMRLLLNARTIITAENDKLPFILVGINQA